MSNVQKGTESPLWPACYDQPSLYSIKQYPTKEGAMMANPQKDFDLLLDRLFSHERFVRIVNNVPMAVMDRTGLDFSMTLAQKHRARVISSYDDGDQQGVVYETERGLRIQFESLL